MNRDIRLATSFRGHRKRKKLKRLLGFGAEVYLIDLWLAVAVDCPEGVLTGWDEEDIADACDWVGDPKELIDAFIESHWLEKDSDGEYVLHDWGEHQGWACKARARSDTAKKAAEARWKRNHEATDKRLNKGTDTSAMLPHSKEHSECNAPSPNPSPNPSPIINNYSDEIVNFTDEFIKFISETKKTLAPKTNNLRIKSADAIDKIIRIDGFEFDDIKKTIRWGVKNHFWANNILSLASLRKKTDGLTKFQKIKAAYDKDATYEENTWDF